MPGERKPTSPIKALIERFAACDTDEARQAIVDQLKTFDRRQVILAFQFAVTPITDHRILAGVIYALGEMGDAESTGTIFIARDVFSVATDREHCSTALRKIAAREKVTLFSYLASAKRKQHMLAAHVLAETGETQALPRLRELVHSLQDRRESWQRGADACFLYGYIGQLGGLDGIDGLAGLITDGSDPRWQMALGSLLNLSGLAADLSDEIERRTGKLIEEALAREAARERKRLLLLVYLLAKPSARARLIRLICHRDSSIREGVVASLEKLGLDVVEALRGAIYDPDPWVRNAAASALRQLDRQHDSPALQDT